jgi:hypothetical protein
MDARVPPDKQFPELAVRPLILARDAVELCADRGFVAEEQLRLTISARAETANELVKPIADGGKGLSQRQAAKVLGVSQETVRCDVTQNVPPTHQAKTRTVAGEAGG